MKRKLKMFIFFVAALSLLATLNWTYQVIRNPVILWSLFASGDYKSSQSTWKAYRHLFERHSTEIMEPKYLAALAQAESAGNPLVIPQWRWRFTTELFRVYAPASTSAGLYQYTRPTFEDAKRFCIHNHQVAQKGLVLNFRSCWFNLFYSRLWPSHAIEMTAARLHHYVEQILARTKTGNTSLRDKQKLASIIHLCGVSRGTRFARSGFDFQKLSQCGSHNTKRYFNRIERIKKQL